MSGTMKAFHELTGKTGAWLQDCLDRNVPGATEQAEALMAELSRNLEALRMLPEDPERLRREPDSLEAIRALRPAASHTPRAVNPDRLASRMAGALNGRFAGCTLGAIVEMNSVEDMAAHAAFDRMDFPPKDYWSTAGQPSWQRRYLTGIPEAYTRERMNGVPVDDDIAYTQLGLLILEAARHPEILAAVRVFVTEEPLAPVPLSLTAHPHSENAFARY